MDCHNETDSLRASTKLNVVCSYDEDQGVICLPIFSTDRSSLDELYLYYIFAHAYQPPEVDMIVPPRSVSLAPVKLSLSQTVNNSNTTTTTTDHDKDSDSGSKNRSLRPVRWPSQTPVLIGHAGAGALREYKAGARHWPDNTVAAFRRSEQLGLSMVECDAIVTRDYEATVLHHNFTLKMHPTVGLTEPREPFDWSYRLDHMPDPSVDEHTKNLITRFSVEELRHLLGNESANCSGDVKPMSHPEPLKPSDPLPDMHGVDSQPLPALADALQRTSTQLGFNVEFKYPTETLLGKITEAVHLNRPVTAQLPGPHRYFATVNKFCDTILDTVWKHAGSRVVVLSSFNADVCAVLRLKQSHLPVLFITRGGISADPTSNVNMYHIDLRHHNLKVAINWAHILDLAGIVTVGKHFGASVSEKHLPNEQTLNLATTLSEHDLACFVYGPGVSEMEFVNKANVYGLSGLIIDRVDGFVQQYDKAKQH